MAAISRDRPLAALTGFFASWRIAAFALGLLVSFGLLELAMLLIPKSTPGLGEFADQFRVWCYGFDRATGQPSFAYVGMFLTQPVIIALGVWLVWRGDLRQAWRGQRCIWVRYTLGGVLVSAGLGAGLMGLAEPARGTELPFPAERLRTHQQAPAFSLRNQYGQPVSLAAQAGKVVIVTGIYASCQHTCPLIMAQLRGALGELSDGERGEVRVLAVTLDPEHDDVAVMRAAAVRYGVDAPQYQLLGGPAEQVNLALDRLEIGREANPMSGEIEHANLFIVVDRRGRVAYRFTLGAGQQRWLVQALQLLIDEPAGGS